MATYTIIGGDQKQYNFVTEDNIRSWIAEGRMNAQSLIKREGEAEFRAVAEFPEFAGAFAAAAVPPPMAGTALPGDSLGRATALGLVKGPAIGLQVTAIVGLVLVALGFVLNLLTLGGMSMGMQEINDPEIRKLFGTLGGGLGIVQDVIGAVVGIIVLIGASKMKRLESFQYAMTASIVAMIPCISPCCVFGLPFGIWALVVLNKPEVKSQFGG